MVVFHIYSSDRGYSWSFLSFLSSESLLYIQVGEKFRNRSLKFPGLVSGCTMDWFHKWPREALVAVSGHFLSPFEIVAADNVKTALINVMGKHKVHTLLP